MKWVQPNYQKESQSGNIRADMLYWKDGSKLDAEYSKTGSGTAKYRIVETYSSWDNYPTVHNYFFAITDTGEGIVFTHQRPMVTRCISIPQKTLI